jgi:hypothetical protein
MRKLFFTLVFGLGLVLSAQAQAQTQEAPGYTSVIKTSPLALALGNFNATYENVLNERSALLFSANYIYQLFGADVNAGGVGAGYRHYFTYKKKDVPTGFYVQPQVSAGFGSGFYTLGIGAELGYQWAWESGFVLDLGIGPQYTYLNFDEGDNDLGFDDDAGGILPAFTLAIGYAW